jgi:DNA-binding CsgD family transcriptional regulator
VELPGQDDARTPLAGKAGGEGREETGLMRSEADFYAYVQDLEKHLQLTLFGGVADPEGVVLLVRGALADCDRARAVALAEQAQRLAASTGAAAEHTRGLINQDPAALSRAAESYPTARARASALEDAGNAWARQGDQASATTLLGQAYTLYEEAGDVDDLARVRSGLRGAGTRLRHWAQADRPAFGWDSLTDTERRIAILVAQGLSNRQVANRVFLSTHTVAFHLRHIFWKLGISSRVHLARLAAAEPGGETADSSTDAG